MRSRHLITTLLMLLVAMSAAAQQNANRLIIPDVTTPASSSAIVPVELENSDQVVALQFTLTMPTGVTLDVSSAKMTQRAADHTVRVRSMGSNNYLVMIYSPTNAALRGQSGTLFTINATIGNIEEGEHPMALSDVALSDINGQNVVQDYEAGKIRIQGMPNLHVISLDCSTPIAGMPLTVSWKVRNDGGGSTEDVQWKDYIWLVPNISVGTSMFGTKLLATVDNVTALEPGESYENTINISLEERIYGNYDLVVTSNMFGVSEIDFTNTNGEPPIPYDPENSDYGFLKGKGNSSYVTVVEGNEFNGISDNFFYKRIDIQVPPLPDIQVPNVVAVVDNSDSNSTPSPITSAGLASSSAFYSGKNIKVTATIANNGGADIASTSVNNILYISNTPDMSDKVIRLGSHTMTLALNVGETTTDEFTATIPYEWYGDTYFIVDVDVNDAVYELANTANNSGRTNLINTLLTPGADFEPFNLSVPPTISSGKSFDVSYSVHNIGPGVPFSNTWVDKIYISSKSTGLDETARELGQFTRKGGYQLVANSATGSTIPGGTLIDNDVINYQYQGDNYSATYSVNVSDLADGTYYIYVQVDANNAVLEYDGENNNVIMSEAIQLNSPDLTVELVSLSEEILSTDTKVAVTWRLKNIGTADIQNMGVTDGFYAASNASGSNAISLGEATNTISIVAGGEKILRTNITIPKDTRLNGPRYFYVKTNINNTVKELNLANNKSEAVTKQFVYVEDPTQATINGTNLTISSSQVASTATTGESLSISYNVKNTGTLDISKNVSQEIFISKKSSFDQTARPLAVNGTTPNLLGLQAGESVTANVNITVPSDMIGGQSYIYVLINRDRTLTEKNMDDNQVKSPVYINGNLPNLEITNLVVPSIVKTSVNTEVSWTLSNTGSWASNEVTCAVYLSTNATLDNNDKQIASVVSNKLAINGSQNMNTTIKLDDDVVGNRYLIVKAVSNQEELSTDDNVASQSFTAEQSPLPDLSISNLATDATWRSGQIVTITATVTNVGESETRKDKWADVFYLSDGYTQDFSNAIKLGSKTHVGTLEADGSYQISAEFTIPQSVQGYYILYAVTDGNNALIESNKDNNQAMMSIYVDDVSSTPADLVVNRLAVDSRIMAGEAITISYDIANQGEYVARGTLRDVLYMSKDNTWDENDVMVGVATGNVEIEPGAEITRSVTGRITNMPEGNYYLIVRTNSTHAISESDYVNNQIVSPSASSIAFYTLDLGSSTSVNTSGLYKLPLHSGLSGKTIGVYLSTPENTSAGLYTAYESVPSTARYDRSASDIESTEQEVLIPDVQEGNYYILAQDNAAISRSLNEFVIDGEQDLTETLMNLTAHEVQFGATRLSINEGGTNGWISTEIHGALLDSIMDFRLTREQTMIPIESLTFYDQTSTKVSFNLNDAEVGSYDVVSELPNGTQATLPNGFHVVPGTNVPLGVKLEAPEAVRINGYAPVTVAYANGGNTDIVIRELLLTIDGGQLSTTIEGLRDNPQTELHIRPDVKQDNRGFVVIPPGKQETVNYYFLQTSGMTYLNLYIIK